MVQIGDTKENGMYPGMTFSEYSKGDKAVGKGLALLTKLECPLTLENCKIGSDGWPYVFNPKHKIKYGKLEKLESVLAHSKEKCRDFCQLTDQCNSASYRPISK